MNKFFFLLLPLWSLGNDQKPLPSSPHPWRIMEWMMIHAHRRSSSLMIKGLKGDGQRQLEKKEARDGREMEWMVWSREADPSITKGLNHRRSLTHVYTGDYGHLLLRELVWVCDSGSVCLSALSGRTYGSLGTIHHSTASHYVPDSMHPIPPFGGAAIWLILTMGPAEGLKGARASLFKSHSSCIQRNKVQRSIMWLACMVWKKNSRKITRGAKGMRRDDNEFDLLSFSHTQGELIS